MAGVREVIQGTSLTLTYGLRPAEALDVGWACTVTVVPKGLGKTGTASITKSVITLTPNNLFFETGLTPDDTDGLAVGEYYVMAELDNATALRNAEVHDVIKIVEQGVA